MIQKTTENMRIIEERFRKAQEYAWSHREELISKYGGESVAILGDKVVDHAESSVKLWQRVNRKPYENGHIESFAIISSINILLSSSAGMFRHNPNPLEVMGI